MILRNPAIGFTQPGQCLANSYNYNIRDYPTNSTSDLTNPILYDGADHSCIDDKHLQSCDAFRTDQLFQLSAELFVRHFKAPDGIHFPYYISVIVIGFVHLFLAAFSYDYSDRVDIRRHILGYTSKVSGFILGVLALLSSYSCRLTLTQSCNTIMVSLDEAAVFCRRLTSCGLTLASVYSANWTTAYGYSSVMFIFGVIIVLIHTCHLPLMLLNHYYFRHTTHSEVRRLAILSKEGDELTLALEDASWQFISYYITGWKRVKQSASTSSAASAPGTVYSPLTTIEPVIPPVPGTRQAANNCTLCQDLLVTTDNDKKCIELRCTHKFHQVCILQYALVVTNTGCPTCSRALK